MLCRLKFRLPKKQQVGSSGHIQEEWEEIYFIDSNNLFYIDIKVKVGFIILLAK